MHEILTSYQLHGELAGLHPEIRKGVLLYRPEALFSITEELYLLLKKEVENAITSRPN